MSAALSSRAPFVSLPLVERLGIEDVVVTLQMDGRLKLVVTGTLPDSPAEITAIVRDRDLTDVYLDMADVAHDAPYTFATLDLSVRDDTATLLEASGPLPAGQQVTIRALTTLGEDVTYRIHALGVNRSVAPEALELHPRSDD